MHFPDLSLPISDPVLIFALVMGIILVLPLLFQRIRVPGIVGLILAGVAVGPHALNVLARDQTMELLGTVGLLYIMFIAGLEVDLNEFRRQRHRSVLFGLVTFALPQGLGALVAHYALGFGWPAAVLLGAVFASHTLLAYPIISRLGLAKGEAVTTAVGATILTDTAALLVLAVIVRAAEGGLTPLFGVQMAGLLAAYVTLVLWGLPRLGRWFFQQVRSDGVFEFVFVLAAVFTTAFLAALAGVEPIIGAFLAGLALNRLVPEHSTLMSRTRFVGEALFIPFFLLSVGMLVDVRVFAAGAEAWTVAGLMLVTVTATKWLAAQATRPLFGYSSDQALMLFGLTVPQAAATLATVIIGYNVGLFGGDVLNGTILMMPVTCMVGPWAAERYGRRVALRAERTRFEPSRAPQRILVPLANPETAPQLMDLALMVWQPSSEQPIYPLAVVRSQEDVQGGVAAAEKLLGHAVVHAAAADVPVTPVVRVDRNAAHGIERAIQERLISTVVIGWSGRSSGRHYTFGSVLDQLLQETHELVLVSKIERPLATTGRVVLAVPPYAELEPGFADVVRTVKGLASQLSASVLVLAADERVAEVERQVAGTRPVVPVAYAPLAAWSRLVSTYETLRAPDDLLLLLAARQGTLAWRPALSRLPRALAHRFPETTLVVGYPPIRVEEAYPAHTLPSGDLVLGGLLSADRITLGLAGRHPEAVLREMLAAAPHDEAALVRRGAGAFALTEADYVPELMPGVVLYHAHVPGLREPQLFVGVSARGLRIPRSSGPVHVVLALLSPEEGAPEAHLRSLALVARLVRAPETIDRLREAATPEAARAVLVDSFLVPSFGWPGRPAKARRRLRDEVPGDALYGTVGVVVTPQSEPAVLLSEALHRTITLGKRMHLLSLGPPSAPREDQLRRALQEAGLSPETPMHWLDGEAGAALPEAAREHAIDLLMVEAFEDARRLGTRLSATAEALVRGGGPPLLLLTRPRLQPEPYRRIVCVVGDDEEALLAYRRVLRLAARERAERVYLVRILPRHGEARILAAGAERDVVRDAGDERPRRTLAAEQEALEDLVHAGGETDVPVRTFCLEGRPGVAAPQFAARYRADLLVMPAAERFAGLADRLYPAETSWGLQDAPCDVWITGAEG